MMASQPTLDQKVVELQWYIDRNTNQTPKSSRPKIQRVAEYLRKREKFEKHYTPRFVSIGPIHHGSTNLELGEEYKLMWAAEYIKNTGSIQKDLHKKISDNIHYLKDHFSDDVLTNLTGKSLAGFGSLEEKLSWMLFVDGCSLLHILEKSKLYVPGHMNIIVMVDVLLLENQLPYEVLKLLWKDEDESGLINSMSRFPNHLCLIQHSVSMPDESQLETPNHLLDLHRKIILTASNSKTKSNEAAGMKWSQKLLQKIQIWSRKLLQIITKWKWKLYHKIMKWIGKKSKPYVEMVTYRNIQDLKAVGIRLKSSMTQRPTDIDFCGGWFAAELTLPVIIVNDSSAPTFLNLIAYEMCPDFENNYGISSFVAFMDSLIDHPEDVKELRSKRILLNKLGSDAEVADLFNIITTDLVRNEEIYLDVKLKIHDHYCNKYKTWIAQGFDTYFSSPWAIIAFIAAVIVLALTFIQTWFTIQPTSK